MWGWVSDSELNETVVISKEKVVQVGKYNLLNALLHLIHQVILILILNIDLNIDKWVCGRESMSVVDMVLRSKFSSLVEGLFFFFFFFF